MGLFQRIAQGQEPLLPCRLLPHSVYIGLEWTRGSLLCTGEERNVIESNYRCGLILL